LRIISNFSWVIPFSRAFCRSSSFSIFPPVVFRILRRVDLGSFLGGRELEGLFSGSLNTFSGASRSSRSESLEGGGSENLSLPFPEISACRRVRKSTASSSSSEEWNTLSFRVSRRAPQRWHFRVFFPVSVIWACCRHLGHTITAYRKVLHFSPNSSPNHLPYLLCLFWKSLITLSRSSLRTSFQLTSVKYSSE
jgi:hypothetical protein